MSVKYCHINFDCDAMNQFLISKIVNQIEKGIKEYYVFVCRVMLTQHHGFIFVHIHTFYPQL